MSSEDELRKTLIERARKEAEKIIEEAKKRAKEIVEQARREYERRVARKREEVIKRIIEEESRRYTAKIVELNKELVRLKNEVLNNLRNEIINYLKSLDPKTREESLRKLLKEAINSGVFSEHKVVVRVVRNDKEIIEKIIKKDKELKKVIVRVEELGDEYIGGVLIESEDGSIALDNTYKSRIERLTPEIVRKLNEEIFEVSK